MAKTVTVRLDDKVYELIRNAAEGERRSISNFLGNVALRYLTDEITVSDKEMEDILADAEAGRYRIAE
jgi:predicted transcriptional regulator